MRITVVGELDVATAPELDRVLDELPEEGYSHILLDLDGVQFMDSTGLSALFRAHKIAGRRGQRTTIRCSTPQVQKLFELTGMLDHFTFEDSIAGGVSHKQDLEEDIRRLNRLD
jgi:anti-anti-sigma factor